MARLVMSRESGRMLSRTNCCHLMVSRGRRRARRVEDAPRQLHVLPGWALPRLVAKKCSRVIGDDEWNAMISVNLSTQFADWRRCLQERLRGEPPQRENDARPKQLELATKVWLAGEHFIRKRISISRWTMLQHVA